MCHLLGGFIRIARAWAGYALEGEPVHMERGYAHALLLVYRLTIEQAAEVKHTHTLK